jgi:hypothetical protein
MKNTELTTNPIIALSQREKIDAIINQAITEAKAIYIIDKGDVTKAMITMKVLAKTEKDIDAYRKDMTAPLEAKKKAIIALFNEIVLPVTQQVKRLKQELLDFEMNERAKAEKEISEMQVLNEDECEISLSLPNRSITGISTTRRKTWEIIDMDLIPREYLTIDTLKLNEFRKQFDFKTISPIPGIAFTCDETVRS